MPRSRSHRHKGTGLGWTPRCDAALHDILNLGDHRRIPRVCHARLSLETRLRGTTPPREAIKSLSR